MRDDNQRTFIQTVRQALGKPPDGGSVPALFHIPPADLSTRLARYAQRTSRQRNHLLDELTVRAEAVAMGVSSVPDVSAAGEVICNLVRKKAPEWGGGKRVVIWDHPLMGSLGLGERLAGDGVPVTATGPARGRQTADDRLRLRREVEAACIGVTSADFVVAQTATLVMRSRPGHLRSVSLVPSIHICAVYADQLVADLEELYTRLQWDPEQQKQGLTNCLTFVSAPSKTGDIELVMVNGAHGPREVHLVLITK